jgi:predicted DNA binding CopG/RHH family protein
MTSRVPKFRTVEDEALFWDTHSTTEFEDEFEDVSDEVRFVVRRGQPKKGITVRLTEDALAALREEAAAKGIGPSTLARVLILDHLQRQGHSSRPG